MAAQLQRAKEIGRAAVLAERGGKKALKEEQRRANAALKREMEKVEWEREEGKKALMDEQRKGNVALKKEMEKVKWEKEQGEKNAERGKEQDQMGERELVENLEVAGRKKKTGNEANGVGNRTQNDEGRN